MERKKRKLKVKQQQTKRTNSKPATFRKWIEEYKEKDLDYLKPYFREVEAGGYIYSFKPKTEDELRKHVLRVAGAENNFSKTRKALQMVGTAWKKYEAS